MPTPPTFGERRTSSCSASIDSTSSRPASASCRRSEPEFVRLAREIEDLSRALLYSGGKQVELAEEIHHEQKTTAVKVDQPIRDTPPKRDAVADPRRVAGRGAATRGGGPRIGQTRPRRAPRASGFATSTGGSPRPLPGDEQH